MKMRKLLNIKKMRTMLPSILMLLATGWFAACSLDDEHAVGLEPSEGETPISFGGAVDDDEEQVAGSRATQLGETVGTFKLYGYKNTAATEDAAAPTGWNYTSPVSVFGGYTMTYNAGTGGSTPDNTHGWSYVNGINQTLKYWDPNAKAYRFMAYAPVSAGEGSTDANKKVVNKSTSDEVVFEVKVNAADATTIAGVPYISKMWFSNNNYDSSKERPYGSAVQMEFFQPYVKVRFMFIDEAGQQLKADSKIVPMIDKTTIKFAPADGSAVLYRGYVTVTYPLVGTATAESYTYRRYDTSGTFDSYASLNIPYEESQVLVVTDSEGKTPLQKWWTLLPNNTQGAYNMSMTVNGVVRTATVPREYMQWNVGCQYTYVFKLAAESGDLTFQPELFVYDKWQAGYSGTTTW